MKDYIRITLQNIKNRKLRAWLTILGIVVGIASIVALFSLSQGLENAVKENFETLGISNIRITAPNLRGPPSGETGVDEAMVDIAKSVKGVKNANPLLLNFGLVEYNNQEIPAFIAAEDPDASSEGFADAKIDLVGGRYMQGSDNAVAIIGSTVAEDMFEKEVKLRSNLVIQGQKFKVIGILEKTGTNADNNIIIPIDTARVLFDRPTGVNVIIVSIEAGEEKASVVERIKRRLDRQYDDDEYAIFTPDQLLDQLFTILGIVQAVLVGVAAISLLVGSVGIMNSMFTSVLERTREIGIMKAIGASNGAITLLFLIESGSIGLIGGSMGALFGSLMSEGVEFAATQAGFGLLKVKITFSLIAFALGFAFIVGMLSGVLPALKAARLKPVDALRYE